MRSTDPTKVDTTAHPTTLEEGLTKGVTIFPNEHDTSTTVKQETTSDFFDNDIFGDISDFLSTAQTGPDPKPTVEYSTRVTSSISSSTSKSAATTTSKKPSTVTVTVQTTTTNNPPSTVAKTVPKTTTKAPTTVPKTTTKAPTTARRTTTTLPITTEEPSTSTAVPETTTEDFVARNFKRLQLLLAAQNARQRKASSQAPVSTTEATTQAFTLEPTTENVTEESTTQKATTESTTQKATTESTTTTTTTALPKTSKAPVLKSSPPQAQKPKTRPSFSDAEDLDFLVRRYISLNDFC